MKCPTTKCHSKSSCDENELERLFDLHYGLIVSQAISFKPRNHADLEDFIQEGAIGMIRAIRNYKVENGTKFSTYATHCIRNAIYNYLKRNKHHHYEHLEQYDLGYTASDNVKELFPKSLTANELSLLELKLNGHTAKEIADELGWTIAQVRNTLHRCYKQIKESYEATDTIR